METGTLPRRGFFEWTEDGNTRSAELELCAVAVVVRNSDGRYKVFRSRSWLRSSTGITRQTGPGWISCDCVRWYAGGSDSDVHQLDLGGR